MNKLCLEKTESCDDIDTTYYVGGYKLNYDNNSTKSASNASTEFLNSVFEKSFTRKSFTGMTPTQETTQLSAEEIRDRCRIAYEGRNNMVSIEGHCRNKESRLN